MYFVLGKNRFDLPYSYKVNDLWLSTSYESKNYGYKLGEIGGNFVNFTDNEVEFSYHKDFNLYCNDEIILTNIEIQGSKIPSDVISYNFINNEFKHFKFNESIELEYSMVVDNVYKLLLQNIQSCIILDEPKIVFTGGLDSSTIAFIAHANGIDFTCLIDERYKNRFKNLPFKNIKYTELQQCPNFLIDYGPTCNIKSGFYQSENNMAITGYYGDNCLVHNSDMFFQAKSIHPDANKIFVYDRKSPSNYPAYKTKKDIHDGIRYINTQNYFRHWFNNFQILDPYRDPRLPELIMNLDTNNLIEQIGSAKIQKDIIARLDLNWLKLLTDHKNEYDKF